LEDWKIKIAVLWLILTIAMLVFGTLGVLETGYIEELIAGEIAGVGPLTPEMNLELAIVMLIPLVMAVLSLTLKDSINRWANIIAGAVFAVLVLADPIIYLTEQSDYSAYVTLIGIVEFVAAVSIVWFAWKSKQKT
jgi:hypothetical protein